MANSAINWALTQHPPRPSQKFVLLLLANRADEKGICFPCVKSLCADSELDRKTVLAALHSLRESKLIIDTGERIGRTQSVIVYRLPFTKAVPKVALLSGSRNGTAKQSQNVAQAVPKTDGSSPVFTRKQSQKRDTEPSGTSINHQEPNGKPLKVWEIKEIIAAKQELADELKLKHAWEDNWGVHWKESSPQEEFVELRKEVKTLKAQLRAMG